MVDGWRLISSDHSPQLQPWCVIYFMHSVYCSLRFLFHSWNPITCILFPMLSSYYIPIFISSSLNYLNTLPFSVWFKTSNQIFSLGQYTTSMSPWYIWSFMKKYIYFVCFVIFDLDYLPLFPISMVLFLYLCNFLRSTGSLDPCWNSWSTRLHTVHIVPLLIHFL